MLVTRQHRIRSIPLRLLLTADRGRRIGDVITLPQGDFIILLDACLTGEPRVLGYLSAGIEGHGQAKSGCQNNSQGSEPGWERGATKRRTSATKRPAWCAVFHNESFPGEEIGNRDQNQAKTPGGSHRNATENILKDAALAPQAFGAVAAESDALRTAHSTKDICRHRRCRTALPIENVTGITDPGYNGSSYRAVVGATMRSKWESVPSGLLPVEFELSAAEKHILPEKNAKPL